VRNRGLAPSTAIFGEVGLSGEIRGIPQAAMRVREAVQMGFTRIVMPAANIDAVKDSPVVGVRTVGEALDELI
jgi:DNA repair protein RadA/Sms